MSRKRNSLGRQPTHLLKMRLRDKDGTGIVAVGWLNDKGGISMQLKLGVVLSFRDNDHVWLTLWPNDYDGPDVDQEIPF